MITTDEAINLLCIAKGDSKVATRRAADVAVKTALGVIVAQGGSGWDFEKEDITFTTTLDQQTYYINKLVGVTVADSLILDTTGRITVISDVWYTTTHVYKEDQGEWKYHYQGQTGTGTPKCWTAYGNQFKVGPIPAGAYELNIEVVRPPLTIEEMPENRQFAVIYTAIRLMFPPTKDYVGSEKAMEIAIEAMRAMDGVMDFGDKLSGGGFDE